MHNRILISLLEQDHWQAILCTLVAIIAVNWIDKRLFMMITTIKAAKENNKADFMENMKRPKYAAVMRENGGARMILQFLFAFVVAPYSIKLSPQP
jgi:hypothetical protein